MKETSAKTDFTGEPREHIVNSEEAGMRLDRLARRLFGKRPLAWVYQQIRTGGLKVDGKKRAQDYRLKEGERVTLPLAPEKKERPRAGGVWKGEEPRIIREEEGWLALDKPVGLAVQGGTGTGASNVVEWLRGTYPEGEFIPSPVHRIDRETSGLLLCARKASVARRLLEEFKGRRVIKEYLAIVEGRIEKPLRIDAPLARVSRKGPTQMGVRSNGQPSVTEIVPLAAQADFSVVLARPLTGRTHQIRAHLAHAGHALAGDSRYGGAPAGDLGLRQGAFYLHAWRLSFPSLEEKGKRIALEAPLPQRFSEAIEHLGLKSAVVLARAPRPASSEEDSE